MTDMAVSTGVVDAWIAAWRRGGSTRLNGLTT